MMCGHAKELIAASWTGEIDAAAESKLKHHLTGCAECGAEMTQLTAMWERLADLPAPEPSHALNVRWQSTLDSLVSARRQNQWRFSLSALWPQRPVWQVSVAAACLAIGLGAGSLLHLPFKIGGSGADRSEIASLREEVASTKQMVALSLLQQQSATERLRGVDYSVRMPAMEPDVVSALVTAVNRDSNVNVRLAAIDALSKVASDPGVRKSLTQSLNEQQSPLVQAALIDYVVDAHDGKAIGALKQFTEKPDLNPLIRQRADMAMQQLRQYK
ncbi:MAG TPA: HEAT repeat domain-containing protein [Bryobacteraceae bacterium]|nr:HEAT repeat domain-containing protein [Bryobacteraceae bacterium]